MYLTAVNFAKKAKSRIVMVMMESLTSGHRRISFRDKQSDQRELIAFDPYVRMLCVYKELKKVRTMRGKFDLQEHYNTPKFNENGDIIVPDTRKRKIPTLDPNELKSNVI